MARETKAEAARLRADKESYARGLADGKKQSAGSPDGVHHAVQMPPLAAGIFQHIMARGDGWVRVVPDEHGKTVYMKYKFTSGKWAGFYTMYVGVNYPGLSECFIGLRDKLDDCDAGMLTPSVDKYHQF